MKRLIVALIVPLYCGTIAFAEPTRFGSDNGVVVGSQSQEVNSGYTIGGGDLYVADQLYVTGTETHNGATTTAGAETHNGAETFTATLTSSGKRIITPNTQTGMTVSSQIVVTSEFMVISTTGVITSTAAPLISTATATNPNGTRVEILNGGSSAITIQDKGTLTNSCLSLGGATRVLGAGDTIILKIYNGIWYEFSYANNQ